MKKIYLAALAGLVLFTACHRDDKPKERLSKEDRIFMDEAAYANRAEVEAGAVARDRGDNDSVKHFGEHMVAEHSQAYDELKNIGRKNFGYSIPSSPDSAHIEALEHLKMLSGMDFDSSYINSQIADHLKAISLFEAMKEDADSRSLRAYAEKYLPHIRQHLAMADSIKALLQ